MRRTVVWKRHAPRECRGESGDRISPSGSGARSARTEIARRLGSIFLRDENGRRPVYGGARRFQEDPHWRDLILFYEYFHGDNGAGLGASHQTGWTGVIARAFHLFATSTAEQFLEIGKEAAIVEVEPAETEKRTRTSQPQALVSRSKSSMN